LRDGFAGATAERDIPLLVQGLDSTFHTFFTETTAIRNYRDFRDNAGSPFVDFAARLLENGVLAMIDGRWYVSLAHSDSDADRTVAAFGQALEDLI
jgi:glutamate-1-semialdehyde aminotransferase